MTKNVYEEKPSLLIYHEKLFNHQPLFGMSSCCQILQNISTYIVVHVMMREMERGDLEKSSAMVKV